MKDAETTTDRPPFVTLGTDRPGPALILCDHASNHVPSWVSGGDLGLSEDDMNRHIAWDVGAAGVARLMGEAMAAPVILSQYSRLVIDPNRGADDPTLVMKLYDGSIIPANRHISEDEVAERKRRLFDPYHTEIARQIDQMLAQGVEPPHLISVHSFTPQLRGQDQRPWQVGVLWDRDERLARPLIDTLGSEPGTEVGDNQPYTGQLQGDCMHRHGTLRGLPHVLIEVRNDLIAAPEGQKIWAERLARALNGLIPVAGSAHNAKGR